MTEPKTIRERPRPVENPMQDAMETWNTFAQATTTLTFDLTSKAMQHTLELGKQTQQAADEVFGVYRKMYEDGFKLWQGYMADVNKVFMPIR